MTASCFLSGGSCPAHGGAAQRVPHPVHGVHHGGLLPAVLDAVRSRSHDGNVRPAGPRQPGGQRGAVAPRHINPVIYILMNKQFYRCFLILFGCKHQLTENGASSVPSRTTVLQLHRRPVPSSPVTKPAVDPEATSGALSDKTEPTARPEISS
ncbi:opsin-3-like [Scomber scombrus]|uniref:Opsin-3-like n=1 Tax=Scomber scombrus TaxID=13677 RepID=A0AAV1QM47_SCOSC